MNMRDNKSPTFENNEHSKLLQDNHTNQELSQFNQETQN